jgi:hypothetical protein
MPKKKHPDKVLTAHPEQICLVDALIKIGVIFFFLIPFRRFVD